MIFDEQASPSGGTQEVLRDEFWRRYDLSVLTDAEWEALCDGCGVCCLVKFLDEEDPYLVEYTDVACQLLDCKTGQCSNYAKRQVYVPDCIRLTAVMLPKMLWLPEHCAYKRLYLGQDLPAWHYLISGWAVHKQALAQVGAQGRVVSERGMSDELIETRIVRWVQV